VSESPAPPFTPEVIAAVMRHMNDDHQDDSLLICRALGGQPSATSAVMSGMDSGGIDFAATVDGREVAVRLPWSGRVTERAQIRAEVVRMHEQACAILDTDRKPPH
jgi:putative heme iron utilization protein